MTHFVARTVASGDAMHDCTLFVINDHGAWLLKRPQDYARSQIPELIRAGREHRLTELYLKERVRIADQRVDIPREVPFVAPFNKWMANVQGTTYFLPVAELSALYINLMLSAFDHDFCFSSLTTITAIQPAGISQFARSAGGHLENDPAKGRIATISFIETWVCEFVAVELGGIFRI